MKTVNVNTLGIEYSVQVPESVEEYNLLAKRENAVLDDAIENVWYRGGAAKARDVLYDGILKAKGLSRPTEEKKLKDGTVKNVEVDATRPNILAALGDEPIENYAYVLEEWSKTFAFDPSVAERSAAATMTKGVENALKKIVEAGAVPTAAQKLASVLGAPVEATEDGVKAALITLDQRRREAERAAKKAAAAEFNAAVGL